MEGAAGAEDDQVRPWFHQHGCGEAVMHNVFGRRDSPLEHQTHVTEDRPDVPGTVRAGRRWIRETGDEFRADQGRRTSRRL